MISDVLSAAVDDCHEYLEMKCSDKYYHGTLRTDILKLLAAMDAMRARLDMPPFYQSSDKEDEQEAEQAKQLAPSPDNAVSLNTEF